MDSLFREVEKGVAKAMDILANLYFKAHERIKDDNTARGYITILLWNDEIEKAINVYRDFFDTEERQREVNQAINTILLNFIAKKQYNFIYGIFKDTKYALKDKYKPVYYALISLMGEKYSEELKTIGAELKETIQDVLTKIVNIAESMEDAIE